MKKLERRKYTAVWVAGLVFLLFLAGSILFVQSVSQRNDEDIKTYLADNVDKLKNAFARQVQGDLQVLRGVAISLAEMDLRDTDSIHNILDEINKSNSFIRMGLATTDGLVDLVDLNGETLRRVDVSGNMAFRQALYGHSAVSPAVYEAATGQYVSYAAAPVQQNGEVVAVLCAVNAEETWRDIIAVPVFQGEGYFAIIDSNGVIVSPVVDPNPLVQIGASVFDITDMSQQTQAEMKLALRAGRLGHFIFSFGGEEQLSVIEPLGIHGWSVIGVAPHSALTAYYNQTAIGTSIIIFVASLAFIALLVWQIRVMSSSQKELERIAYVDGVTGLRNYTKLLLDAEDLLLGAPQRNYAIWSYDIKRFNLVNDIFGVECGDALLQRVAKCLAEGEDEHTLAGRVGADNFAGIRRYSSREELDRWFAALCKDLVARQCVAEDEMTLDAAMGIYCVDEFEDSVAVEEMVNRASIAKKEAKEQVGSHRAYFTRQMGEQLRWDAELEASGRAALENGEMVFFLQPKVGIQNGYVVDGAEALVRWKHPQYGFIPPDEFVPLFEHNGFIANLDRYIFEAVCRWLRAYLDNGGAPIQVAVNVSRQGMMRDDFLDYYTGVRQALGLEEGRLELEFTESIIVKDHVHFQKVMQWLQQAGFSCAIDDFGAGYSSLNVLKNLPINVLKLDAEFFRNSDDTERERIVIADFIAMAHRLGIRTVAEGVENKGQVEFLRRAGCDVVQGYVFSKPLPPEEFERFVAQSTAEGLKL